MNNKSTPRVASTQFDWALAQSFLAVLEHGSLLAGARALGTSQPTLGRRIADLEAQLGASLFERTGRGLVPTQLALRLADTARAMEGAALAMARAASGAQSELAGRVRLSASQPVACVLLPPVLAQLRTAYPEIGVELVVSNQLSNLLKREADIALRMVAPEQGSLIAKRIGAVGVGAYAHRDYLQRRGTPKEPSDLLNHELIGGDRHDEVGRGIEAAGFRLDPARFSLRTDDLMAYSAAVRAGLGIGFMSHYMAREAGDLVPVLPGIKAPAIPLWLVAHRELRSNKRIKAVFDFLAHALPPLL